MIEVQVSGRGAAFRSAFFAGQITREFEGATCSDATPSGKQAWSQDVAIALIQLATSIGANVVAAALYDALRGNTPWVRVNGRKVNVSEDELKAALNEQAPPEGSVEQHDKT
jgi:hypothetical protein